jgi:DNA-binding winged helix-turn-helix (wHTH) protein/tetratricopeptide (TPR) repeat protein
LPEGYGRPAIRLAACPPLRLGRLHITPATRQAAWDAETRTLEPRVMQVLIALACAEGAIVGRDELIERCWDGRVVGGNAINRVISLIRRLAEESGAFRLETVTKVGYRLVVCAQAEAEDAPKPPLPSRRAAVTLAGAAGLAVAAGAGAYGVWRARRGGQPAVPEAAQTLMASGRAALEADRPEQNKQALADLKRAVELAPGWGEAWGALALAYASQVGLQGDEALGRDVAWVRSTAERALALTPGQADAETALLLVRPRFRHWAEFEREAGRLLARHPGSVPAALVYAGFLGDVGRWRAAVERVAPLAAKAASRPATQIHLAMALAGAGRLPEAERTYAEAAQRWPAHPWVWSFRFDFLALNGRPGEAMALANDPMLTPDGNIPMSVELGRKVAAALADGGRARRQAAVAALREARAAGVLASRKAAAYFAALGAMDEAFAVLDRYYFGGAAAGAATSAAPLERPTAVLFESGTATLRADHRFAPLLERLDLEAYWRATHTEPDYRRGEV